MGRDLVVFHYQDLPTLPHVTSGNARALEQAKICLRMKIDR